LPGAAVTSVALSWEFPSFISGRKNLDIYNFKIDWRPDTSTTAGYKNYNSKAPAEIDPEKMYPKQQGVYY
ncbi:jg24601, partial [Pararge aegeria aegeria]